MLVEVKLIKNMLGNIYIASAIALYDENLAFNMDETSCRINNGSKQSLAPIIWEKAVVGARRNSKECFTIIDTCSLEEKKTAGYTYERNNRSIKK